MDVQVVSSQGQNSGVKTDGAFLPRILLSGFLLVSVVGDSASPGLQTWSEGEPVPFTLRRALPRRGAGETTAPATRVALATHLAPPLGIFCSMSDQNLSESVASSRSLCFHWELQSQDVSDWPSWIIP